MLIRIIAICEINDTKINVDKNRYEHETSRLGSFIYLLLDEHENVIYVGETEESVRHRLYSDGSGSHCKKEWFDEVKKVKYYRNDEMDWKLRLIIESMLVMKYTPKYNMSKTKRDRLSTK